MALFALRQAVTLAVHLEDVDVGGEAVEQGAGQPFAAQDLGPLVEGQVAGHQRGAESLCSTLLSADRGRSLFTSGSLQA